MIELSPEQRQAVAKGEPVPIVDPLTQDTYVLVRAEETLLSSMMLVMAGAAVGSWLAGLQGHVQRVLGVVSVLLTYRLGRACSGRWAGFSAAVLVALTGPLLTYEQAPLTESPLVLLLVGLSLALVAATRARNCRPAVYAGLLLGLTVLEFKSEQAPSATNPMASSACRLSDSGTPDNLN